MKINNFSKRSFTGNFLVLLFAFSVFFNSCKKDEPSQLTIRLLSPVNGLSFTIGDSVFINGEINSLQLVQRIEVNIKSLSGVAIGPSLNFYPAVKSYSLNLWYPLNFSIPFSDSYSLDVIATDGKTSTHQSVLLTLNNLPRITKSIYCITGNGFDLKVNKLDSVGSSIVGIFQGDFSGAGISSANHILFTSGYRTGGINVFDLEDNTLKATLLPYNTASGNSFAAGEIIDNNFYVTRFDGAVKAYNWIPSQTYTTVENLFFVPHQVVKMGNHVLTDVVYNGSLDRKLNVFFYPSGVPRQQKDIDFNVRKLLTLSDDSCLIFGEKNGRFIGYFYFINSNIYNQFKDFGTSVLFDAILTTNHRVLLATDQGLMQVDLSSYSAFPVFPGPVYEVEQNELTEEIYCASGHNVVLLNSSFIPQATFTFTDSVMAIKAEYSR